MKKILTLANLQLYVKFLFKMVAQQFTIPQILHIFIFAREQTETPCGNPSLFLGKSRTPSGAGSIAQAFNSSIIKTLLPMLNSSYTISKKAQQPQRIFSMADQKKQWRKIIRKNGLVCVITFVLFLMVSCGNEKSEKTETEITAKNVQRKTQETLETTQAYLKQGQEKFAMDIEYKLNAIEEKIEQLEKRAENATAETKDKYNEIVEELHQRRDVARDKLDELKSAGIDVWEDLKFGMNVAYTDLENFFNKAVSEFQ
ncbi:MAG: hypothetical protein E3K37_04020 [Candidatus Kuenenia sp.]|nr:hypothetical protein [Candidatus Kuenenia hertensis]